MNLIIKNLMLERLYELMDAAGVNEKQVTTELNISRSSFSDWKKGKGSPKMETLVKLASYFGVSLDYLITGRERGAASGKYTLERDFREKLSRLTPDNREKLAAYMDELLKEE